jgi:hypothetical protein
MCITRQNRLKLVFLNNHEILSHNSCKIIEIYTQLSTKSIQQIKSPFDDL